MLEYLFGDAPQVEAIEKIIKSNDDCNTFPSKEEINDLEISKETFDSFDADFLKLVYLTKHQLSNICKIISLKDKIDKILPEKHSFREEFDKVSKNYMIYEEEYVKIFFTKRYGLINYVNHITPIINRYFQDYPKMIVFHQDPEIDSLSHIGIYIKSSKDEDKEILKKLNRNLWKSDLFPNDIKFICSVKLDSHNFYFNNDEPDESYLKYCEFYGESNKKILEFF